ncbi:hypothetical protein O9X98_05140 [Agrobacterium salinitolerans]|nr:hypothetical protein [Agrobacterium salinitolerans]
MSSYVAATALRSKLTEDADFATSEGVTSIGWMRHALIASAPQTLSFR